MRRPIAPNRLLNNLNMTIPPDWRNTCLLGFRPRRWANFGGSCEHPLRDPFSCMFESPGPPDSIRGPDCLMGAAV